MTIKQQLLGSVALGSWAALGLLASTVALMPAAFAQQAPASAAAAVQTDQLANTIEEVTVTAQRRKERSVDVPVSITSVTASQLGQANVTSAIDLGAVTAGVEITKLGSYLQPTIRGIGTSLSGAGAESNIAIYIDGIYQPSQQGNVFDFNNITQIDVLKGPQGTLFGRNATGGAILITTADPSHDFNGNVSVGTGSFGARQLGAYVTGGLLPNLAADIAIYDEEDEGYTKDIISGAHLGARDEFSARSKFLFTPTDDMKFILTLTKAIVNDPQSVAIEDYRGNALGAFLSPNVPVATRPGETSLNFAPKASSNSTSVNLKSEFNLDAVRLTSYTSYRNEDQRGLFDLDGTASPILQENLNILQKEKTFQQELDLNGTDTSFIDWVAGLSYYNDESNLPELRVNKPIFNSSIRAKAYAAFADATVKVTQDLSLIGGIRDSIEGKDLVYQQLPPTLPVLKGDHYWHDVTFRAGLRYALTEHSNVYGLFSQGFKSGTFATDVYALDMVQPEKVNAVEFGFKHAEHDWTLDLASFFDKYHNLQVTSLNFANGLEELENAAQSRIYGIEAQGSYRFDENFSIRAATAWTHARYVNFTNPQLYHPSGVGGNVSFVPPAINNKVMIRAPEVTANATFLYTREIRYGTLEFAANPVFSSKVYYSYDDRLSQPGYATLNLNASWTLPDDHWTFSVYGKNVTGTTYALFMSESQLQDQIVYAAPGTWGAKATYQF